MIKNLINKLKGYPYMAYIIRLHPNDYYKMSPLYFFKKDKSGTEYGTDITRAKTCMTKFFANYYGNKVEYLNPEIKRICISWKLNKR